MRSARVSSLGPSKVRTSRSFAAVYGQLSLLVALEMLRQLRGRPSHGQLLPCLVHSHASLPTLSCIYQRAFLISSNKSSGFFCFELRRASPGGVPLPLASAAAATSASTGPKALWLGLHLLAGASGGDSWLRCPAGRTCPSAASFFEGTYTSPPAKKEAYFYAPAAGITPVSRSATTYAGGTSALQGSLSRASSSSPKAIRSLYSFCYVFSSVSFSSALTASVSGSTAAGY